MFLSHVNERIFDDFLLRFLECFSQLVAQPPHLWREAD